MKKTISLALTLVLGLGLLAGCGSAAASGEEAPAGTAAAQSATAAASAAQDGAAGPITVISREDGSGTRGAFIELFGIEEKDASGSKVDNTTEDANITNSTAVMLSSVAGDTSAIGYVSLGSMNDTVKALQIDGADATADNIKSGTYAIARPFNVVTKGTLSDAAQDFLGYILSKDGQAVVEQNGYIAVTPQDYTSKKPSGSITVAGSSSVTPVMEKLKEAYAAVNPNVSIEVQQSDSTTGVQSTIDGVCDIGMASRALKDSETAAGVTATVIAQDGIAVIVNNANPLTGLTKDQVKQIFTGGVTEWEDVQ